MKNPCIILVFQVQLIWLNNFLFCMLTECRTANPPQATENRNSQLIKRELKGYNSDPKLLLRARNPNISWTIKALKVIRTQCIKSEINEETVPGFDRIGKFKACHSRWRLWLFLPLQEGDERKRERWLRLISKRLDDGNHQLLKFPGGVGSTVEDSIQKTDRMRNGRFWWNRGGGRDTLTLKVSHDDMVIIWISPGPSLQYSTVRVCILSASGLTLKQASDFYPFLWVIKNKKKQTSERQLEQ